MKKLFVTVLSLGLALAAWGQDYNAALEVYNAAGTNSNLTEKIAGFRTAMDLFAACEDEEAPGKVIECQKYIVDAMFAIASEDIKAKNYEAAFVSLDQAAATATEFGQDVAERKNKYLGTIYNALAQDNYKGNPAVAVENAEKAIEIGEDVAATYLFLGLAKSSLKETDAAIAALEKASELGLAKQAAGPLSNQYLTKCQGAYKAGKFEDAVAAAEKAIECNPKNANAYKLRGNSYVNLKKTDLAVEDFNKYLEVNPAAKDAEAIKKTIGQLKAAK